VEVLRQPLVHSISGANEVYAISDLRPLIRTTARLTRMNEELQVREEQLRTQNLRFDTAISHMTQALCMFDSEQRMVVCNKRYAELYGLTLDQLTPGISLAEIIELRIANGIYAGESPDAYRQERLSSIFHDLDMVQELNDGRFISISLRLMPGGGYVSTHEDVTERRRMEDQLVHMAHHDPLTDLPNRVLLRRKMEKALKGARRGDSNLAVLMLDLDRFKEVNDTLGHLVGDALIKAIAQRLRQGMRKKATVARFGGDEFAIVDALQPADDTESLPKRIQELVNEPVELDGHWVSVGTTIGIAIAPQDGSDPDELLMRADHALYRAKSEARGSYRFFEAQMGVALQERRALEYDLHQALAAGQFELHYQALVNLEQNRISGFEALLRWNHPARGPIPPSLFIPVAEETGLITSLTEWVLQEACTEATKWPAELTVAVNLSVPQFKARNLLPTIVAVLAKTRLPPERLELEITETVMLNDAEAVFAIFRQLRQLGVHVVLDDFGTGFSSLSYLLRFPFDKIKIDRSFIHNLAEGGNSLVLVRSLIQMTLGLGVRVTAEGIETQDQLDIVRAEGCIEVQGYYVSPPRPAAEIPDIRQRFRRIVSPEAAVA
jgi:diguanylate cyclase (GGDEF)-like protein